MLLAIWKLVVYSLFTGHCLLNPHICIAAYIGSVGFRVRTEVYSLSVDYKNALNASYLLDGILNPFIDLSKCQELPTFLGKEFPKLWDYYEI
ncbi:hypothetical protein VNO77_39465 [Canavalia gladiata]|uniref:Uncharacterized protein n=1 Tax=Canavalia gladiata TaxID=3824 RepID=A0AAN9KCM9_CANGL